MDSKEAVKKITEFVGGKMITTYKLRDWVFSRQRYWGEPMPLIFCEGCKKKAEISNSQFLISKKNPKSKYQMSKGEQLNPGWIAVAEKDLPLKLPNVKNYKPTDTGESPLSAISKWVNVKCPVCGGKAKRETDTMPNWAGSSWYYLRYCDPKNKKVFADRKKLDYWLGGGLALRQAQGDSAQGGVDWYNGGMEHTTLHLLYSRFWHKFLFDLGLVPTSEPYKKRTAHGMILAEGGVKMSKSKGNVVNPDEIVKRFGADSLRLYEMFMGPFDQAISWSTDGVVGVRRFLEKVWRLRAKCDANIRINANDTNKKLEMLLNQTIKKVGEDIEAMRFNTAVSSMMILANEMENAPEISREAYEKFLQILAPFAPHIAEELWAKFGNSKNVQQSEWPKFDESKIASQTVRIVVQINGKVRTSFEASPAVSEEEAKKKALELPETKKWLDGKEVKKSFYVKGKLVSFVV
jgi:leucyl-tRNA synthetase